MADNEESITALKQQWDAAWRAWIADVSDEEAWARLDSLERSILLRPAESAGDLLAKLSILKQNIAGGGRSDGMDIDAVDTVISWLGDAAPRG